ncbi:MAG: site-specific integrase, partial [Dehalococcoidia bacterium]|nr:site-specific integrase [Dehalococcoidia bacterium]
QRSKGSWTIVLDVGKDPVTGKRKQQWVTVRGTKRAAEKRLTELTHQLDAGTFMTPGKTSVAEFLERWLEDYAQPNLSPRGFERYAGIVRGHLVPDMGAITLTQLRPEHLQKHYAAMLTAGLSAGTVQYHHAVIHKALGTAVKWGLLVRNVADGVDVPRIRRVEMQTWDQEEAGRFLEAAKGGPYYALFYTALYTGMRRSELLALRWADVDLILCQAYVSRSLHHLKDGRYIFTQPKSAKGQRAIALPPSAALTLREHHGRRKADRAILGMPLVDDDLIFGTLEGEPLRPNTVTRAWTTLAARAGVKVIRLHDARHSHASLMLKQGIHPKIVQERLGHSSIAMTLDIYSHVAPGLQQAAAESFDRLLHRQADPQAAGNIR